MTRKFLGQGVVVTVLTASVVASVSAKGATRRLTVTGPTLAAPIELTDPDALANVWGGEFIGASANEPDRTWPRYVLSFHVQTPRTDAIRVMYVVEYASDPKTGEGFVYVPAPGDQSYYLNSSTILRSSGWHHAETGWSQAINARIR